MRCITSKMKPPTTDTNMFLKMRSGYSLDCSGLNTGADLGTIAPLLLTTRERPQKSLLSSWSGTITVG